MVLYLPYGGSTIHGQGMRVHPNHTDGHYMQQIKEYCMQDITEKFPDLERFIGLVYFSTHYKETLPKKILQNNFKLHRHSVSVNVYFY